MQEGISIVEAMARHGFIANAPVNPSTGFSFGILKLYAALAACCGNVGIQPFVRAVMDFHQVCSVGRI